MRVLTLGSLHYHNETILQPIFNELNRLKIDNDHIYSNETGANVHIPDYTKKTLEYWSSMTTFFKRYAKSGDRILITDFWNPEIVKMRFWAARSQLDVKFYSIHHGSSDLPGDFSSEPSFIEWARAAEASWAQCYDKIFFASHNARDSFLASHHSDPKKAMVTGLPVSSIMSMANDLSTFSAREKNTCIMPLRMDPDKGVDEFIEFVKNTPQIHFYATSPFKIDISKYSDISNLTVLEPLARRDLFALEQQMEFVCSFAKQETFGYAVIEAVINGCKPVLLNSPTNCYSELYPAGSLISGPEGIDDWNNFPTVVNPIRYDAEVGIVNEMTRV